MQQFLTFRNKEEMNIFMNNFMNKYNCLFPGIDQLAIAPKYLKT